MPERAVRRRSLGGPVRRQAHWKQSLRRSRKAAMAMKVHVRKGDRVQVRSGVDAGKRGKVIEVIPSKGRIVVEGVNIQKRHTRPTRENPQGGVIERPGPIYSSKVSLVCPNCDKPTRYGTERSNDGEPKRICRKCGKSID